MGRVEQKDVGRALRVEGAGDGLGLVEEVGEAVARIAGLGDHLGRTVGRKRALVVRRNGRNRQSPRHVGSTNRRDFMAEMLHKRAVIAKEQHQKRSIARVAVGHAQSTRIRQVKVGTIGPEWNHGTLEWRHGALCYGWSSPWRDADLLMTVSSLTILTRPTTTPSSRRSRRMRATITTRTTTNTARRVWLTVLSARRRSITPPTFAQSASLGSMAILRDTDRASDATPSF